MCFCRFDLFICITSLVSSTVPNCKGQYVYIFIHMDLIWKIEFGVASLILGCITHIKLPHVNCFHRVFRSITNNFNYSICIGVYYDCIILIHLISSFYCLAMDIYDIVETYILMDLHRDFYNWRTFNALSKTIVAGYPMCVPDYLHYCPSFFILCQFFPT